MDIMSTVIEITKTAIAHDSNVNMDSGYAAEVVDFMFNLKYGLEQLAAGADKDEVLKKLLPARYEGWTQPDAAPGES